MISLFAGLAKPLLFALEPETAHKLTLNAVAITPTLPAAEDPRLAVEVFGLQFPNPIGLAAGFDKNAQVPDAMLRLGFGFVEVGTLTPRPQAGNPRPRLFRLVRDEAVVNRLGFNNEGHAAGRARLARRHGRGGIVGVNIGANKDASDRAADYADGIATFAGHAAFFTVNVSSPNTPGLRDLQQEAALDDLLARVVATRDEAAPAHGRTPVLLKIAPDLTLEELDAIVAVAKRRAIDGLVIGNTTVTRPRTLSDRRQASETGGLSGKPLFRLSTRVLAEAFQRSDSAFPLVGAGGVNSAAAAWTKIEAGASLVELYTALVFHGPGLIGQIKRGLSERLAASGASNMSEVVGREASAIADDLAGH